ARFRPHVCALYADPGLAPAMAALDVPALSLGVGRVRHPTTPARLLRLARYCREHQVAVVQGVRADALAGLVARLAGAPVALGAQRNTRAPARGGPADLLRRWGDRLLTGVIANSRAAAAHRHALSGLPLERIHVIPNGLDLGRHAGFAPLARVQVAPAAAPGAPLLLILGRLELAMKGHAVLLEALARPELAHTHLAVAGDGPDRPRLEALVAGRGLAGRVTLLGHRDDAPAVLPAADAVVVPSLNSESSPNVILEAWAARRPVVASAVAGVPELLADGETGLLVPPGDAAALAAALRRLLDDPALAARLGAAGRRELETGYTAEAMAARTTGLYERLLARGGAARAAVA
ncbi:MAG TPA: glycosyltransferase, partial [Chloroflexaceae bacterium]|nr:glycosyltransferase [Chloroflexaceae bacterium]